MGSAGCFCSLLSPLLECSAWHSLDTCLVSYDGVGSTHDGRRACCCFGLLLGSPVLGSAGWFCSLLCRFWSVLLGTRQIPAWYCIMGLGPPVLGGGRAAFSLLFTEFGATRNFYMASPPYSHPPASMSGSLPMQWHFLCVVAQVLIYLIQLFSYCLYKSLKPLGIRCDPSLATSSRTN